MSTLDDTVKEQERVARSGKLKKMLNGMKCGESFKLSEFSYIQSIGLSGYIVVVRDRNDNNTGVCHIPTNKI